MQFLTTPVQYSWAFSGVAHQYLSWYSTVFSRHFLTLHFMPGRWCALCLSELVGNSSLLFYTGVRTVRLNHTIYVRAGEQKASYSVGSALLVTPSYHSHVVQCQYQWSFNWMEQSDNTEYFFLHFTINSPAWIAEIHRSTPTSTTVSRAELPISEKTK